MTHRILFRNARQVAIFTHELRGQLSDGHWENTGPRGHWRPWASAQVRVAEAGEQVGRNFSVVKDNYNFSAPDLLDAVSLRMRSYAVLAEIVGLERLPALASLVDIDGYFQPERGAKVTYAPHADVLKEMDLIGIKRDWSRKLTYYDASALKRDLRDMKAIVRNFVAHLGETKEERAARLERDEMYKKMYEIYQFELAMQYANDALSKLPTIEVIEASRRQLAGVPKLDETGEAWAHFISTMA